MYQAHGRSPTARATAGPPATAPGVPPSGAVRAGQIDTPARPPPSGPADGAPFPGRRGRPGRGLAAAALGNVSRVATGHSRGPE